ncbi:MAG: O-antigen ligase family protein [Candidatus Acidiferrales bacterium]
MTKRPRWEKWFCLSCLSVILLGFIFAASRGGFLGLSAALLFLIWHTRRRLRTFALVGLFLLPILLVPGQSAVSRLMRPDSSDQQSTEFRLELWQASERAFLEHPLFGIGMGHFHPQIEKNGQLVNLPFHVAHNTYIGIVTDLGLAGFVPFILVLLGSIRRSNTVARRTRAANTPEQRLLHQVALGIQAGLIGYMVCAFFLSTQWQQVFWFAVFLSMSIPAIEASTAPRQARVVNPAADLRLAHSVELNEGSTTGPYVRTHINSTPVGRARPNFSRRLGF